MTPSFFFYDYETFGVDPMRDRPSQFAGCRTDAELNLCEPPLMFYCQPSPDYLPQPQACLLTGITPQQCLEQGLNEYEFFKRIQTEFSRAQTCVLGYNSLRFDDEVTRFGLYRNLFDPYAREWQQGNSRWDLLDLVRACYALRPDGLSWPELDAKVSFKLELLTQANGLVHEAAHDALSDVYATIALAQRIRQRQPRLFEFYFKLRRKDEVRALLYPLLTEPLVHVSGRYGAERGCMALVLPLMEHPSAPGQVLVYDLSVDPSEFFSLSVTELQQRVFVAQAELASGSRRLPIKTVHLNRSPFLAPLRVVTAAVCQRWSLDLAQQQRHSQKLIANRAWLETLAQVFKREYAPLTDPEQMLYSGAFLSNADRQLLESVRPLSASELARACPAFKDPRLAELLFRFRARNYPDSLTLVEQQRWRAFCQQRLAAQTADFDAAMAAAQLSESAHSPILTQLQQYAQQLTSV